MMLQEQDILKHTLSKKDYLFSHERINTFKVQKKICKMTEFWLIFPMYCEHKNLFCWGPVCQDII